jgi:glycosyltransferase involved in cell wall biosynthesis
MILSIGRLIEKKGFHDLLLACEILRQRGRHFQVEIIGSGPWEYLLQTQTKRLRLQERVRFLGAQPQEVVRESFRRATIFALPSIISGEGDRDGIPTVLMEAMASGTPVVSTFVSGIPELIESGSNGLLVPPNNPLLLADALGQLLNAPELREKLARAARAKMEERFSIEKSARELRALFQNGARR